MTTTTTETDNEKALRRAAKEQKRIEKRKQVISFARDTLGSNKKQAKVFRRVAGKFLKLDTDGLKFKGQGGKLVAIDSDQSKEFFRREYPFLMKEAAAAAAAAAAAEHGALDDADIALARAGNLTAKGRCLLALNGDEAALKAALADKGKGNDTVALADKPLDKSKNPFVGLRNPRTNQIVPEKMKAVESLIRGAGTKVATSIAKSAGLRLDGSPIPEKYI
jgi:hypothetical protein